MVDVPVHWSTDTNVVVEAVSPFSISVDLDVMVKLNGWNSPVNCTSILFSKS